MKISPLEIRQHEFEKTFRGYNIEEVDNFLATISQEWERVLNESKMLRMQLEIAEKEANKLREIEMTLFKTLKTAEDTSNLITEQANQQAEKYLQESKMKSEQLLQDAENEATRIVKDAQSKAHQLSTEALAEVESLEKDYNTLIGLKDYLTSQLKGLANSTLNTVHSFEEKYANHLDNDKTSAIQEQSSQIVEDIQKEEVVEQEIIEPIVEEPTAVIVQEEELTIEEPVAVEEPIEEVFLETPTSEPNAIVENLVEEETTAIAEETIVEPAAEVVQEVKTVPISPDNLEIIEGIGPKIATLLNESGIYKFRDLATTPVFKIKEILENAGSGYANQDPSTWVEQALLAAEGHWNELEALKIQLIRGKLKSESSIFEPVSESAPIIEETPAPVVEPVAEVVETPQEPVATPVIETKAPENNIEGITEEMLEKVNKIKFAIRKAMSEKSDSPKDNTPLPTLKDVVGKQNEGGSFFDNI